jgi:hypothetical protein
MLAVFFRSGSLFHHRDGFLLCHLRRAHGSLGFDLRFATKDGWAHANSHTAKASHARGDCSTTLPFLFIRVESFFPCGRCLILDLRVSLFGRNRLRML